MTWEVAWPWLAFAGLGIFHGFNPAMGWLFAVALGLHRRSRRALLLALPPMAAGHAVAIWLMAASMMALETLVKQFATHLPRVAFWSFGRDIIGSMAIVIAFV